MNFLICSKFSAMGRCTIFLVFHKVSNVINKVYKGLISLAEKKQTAKCHGEAQDSV